MRALVREDHKPTPPRQHRTQHGRRLTRTEVREEHRLSAALGAVPQVDHERMRRPVPPKRAARAAAASRPRCAHFEFIDWLVEVHMRVKVTADLAVAQNCQRK